MGPGDRQPWSRSRNAPAPTWQRSLHWLGCGGAPAFSLELLSFGSLSPFTDVCAHGNWLFSTFHKSWGWGHAGDQEEYQSGLQQGTHPLQTLHIPVYASPSISYLPFFAEFNCLTPTPSNSKQRYSESCMSSRTSYVECLVLEACYCFKISMKRKKIWVLDGSKLG